MKIWKGFTNWVIPVVIGGIIGIVFLDDLSLSVLISEAIIVYFFISVINYSSKEDDKRFKKLQQEVNELHTKLFVLRVELDNKDIIDMDR